MIETTLQWFLALFTPAEWRAMFWLLGMTLAGTHTIKIAWRLLKGRFGGHGYIYLVSAAVAMLSAFIIWPGDSVPWYAAGIVAGPLANVAFKIGFGLLTRWAPDIARTFNAGPR